MKARTYIKYVKLMRELSRRSKVEVVRKAIADKEVVVKELTDLIRKYRTIAVFDLNRMPTAQFKELKRLLSSYGVVKVVKNTLLSKALDEVKPKSYEEFKKVLVGSNAFLFTNLNSFEVFRLCSKFKVKRYAKPGDQATSEIVIPSGPTGIPPGPSLSLFGKLKIPTQVREGFIWIARDTTVARPGDSISPELSSLLRKLDIKVIDVSLSLKVAYEDGIIFRPEDLKLDVKAIASEFMNAVSNAINLAVNAAIPIPEAMPLIVSKAYLNALSLSVEAGILMPENVGLVLSRAVGRALALASVLGSKVPGLGIEVKQPQQAASAEVKELREAKTEESKEGEGRKEVSEEEIAAGLSSLFG